MSQCDVFALKNSSLNTFLFADIGTELNGSKLTILSALARLGKDPWVEAARWAQEPKADAIDSLTASIIDMPLSSQAIHDARSTASRLVLLLPTHSRSNLGSASTRTAQDILPKWAWIMPKWAWIMLAYFWIYLALNVGMALSPKLSPAVSTPIVQPSGPSH